MARRPAELLEGAASLDKGHELALVVACAPGDDLLAVRPGLDPRLKRRIPPEIEWIDRLHVIMAVEQDMRRLAARGLDTNDDHRAAGGRSLRRLEPKIAEFFDQPVRSPLTIGIVRRNRGNGGDRQKREEPVERGLLARV